MIKKVSFPSSAIDAIINDIISWQPLETGGVLMGRVEGDSYIINKVILGGKNAIRELCYFKADSNYIQMKMAEIHWGSNQEDIYLGEWHSHPQTKPVASSEDIESIIDIYQRTADLFNPILLIVGFINLSSQLFFDNTTILFPDEITGTIRKLKPFLI